MNIHRMRLAADGLAALLEVQTELDTDDGCERGQPYWYTGTLSGGLLQASAALAAYLRDDVEELDTEVAETRRRVEARQAG